jgi:hypothetical protein
MWHDVYGISESRLEDCNMTKTKMDAVYGGQKQIKQEVLTTQVNHDGEIIHQSNTTVFSVGKEPNYIKLYMADICYMKDMPKTHHPILQALLGYIHWGTNQLILNASLKKDIADSLGVKMNTLDKAILGFVRAEILIRKAPGVFVFNPYLFGSGHWDDIQEIRMNISYNLQGRTFSTAIKHKGHSESDGGDTNGQ